VQLEKVINGAVEARATRRKNSQVLRATEVPLVVENCKDGRSAGVSTPAERCLMRLAIDSVAVFMEGKQVYLKRIGFARLLLASIFFITGFLKLISALGSQPILQSPEVFSGVPTRGLLIIIGLIEIVIVIACLKVPSKPLVGLLVLWFVSCAVAYRSALAILAPEKPCPCLGNVSAWTGMSEYALSRLSIAFLIVMGLCALSLVLGGVQHRKALIGSVRAQLL
jgi:hypothetical protein